MSISFYNVRVRANRDADPVRVNVVVDVDDEQAAIKLGAKLALIRWQDEVRRLGKLPRDGETVHIKVSAYASERRTSDPLAKAKQQLAKLSPAEREQVLKDLGLLG